MRAIYVTETGGPEVLTLTEQPEPTPGPGDLLVRTEAIGINFIDTYFRMGQYKRPLPYIPGDEGTASSKLSVPTSPNSPLVTVSRGRPPRAATPRRWPFPPQSR